MRWSFRIARIAGIDVRVHATFGLVLALGASLWGSSHGAQGALFGVALVAALFGCVVLHELGHAMVARRLGLAVGDIVLLPIGGVAELRQRPRSPRDEILISLAGPAVNLVLAVVLGGALLATGAVSAPKLAELVASPSGKPGLETALVWLTASNVALALFNLVPALPMDGGRVLRAALALKLGGGRATRIASVVGQALAAAGAAHALASGHWVLLAIAVLVFLGARRERDDEDARAVLSEIRAGDACNLGSHVVAPHDRLHTVTRLLLTTPQTDFAVIRGGELRGVVRRSDVLLAAARGLEGALVADVMRSEVPVVPPGASLEEARELMALRGAPVLAVLDGPELLGLVSAEDLAEVAAVAGATGFRPGPPPRVQQTATSGA